MKILMIDRSSITDRRIVLEANLLQAQGHTVELVASSMNSDDWPEVTSLRVRRFPDSAFGDTTEILNLRNHLGNYVGKRFALLAAVFLKPSLGFNFVSGANSLSRSKIFALQSVLGLLSGQIRLSESKKLAKAAWTARRTDRFVPDKWESTVIAAIEGESFDVIHVHDLPTLDLGVHLKSLKRAKLVYDAHELYCYLPGMSDEAQQTLKGVEGRSIRATDLVVLINEDQAKRMLADYGPFNYVCLTNATMPDGVSDVRSNRIRERLAIPTAEKILIFQGYVSRDRNIDSLIEGVALSKARPHVVFLSWGPEIADFRRLAQKLGVEDRVHFLPPVPWNEVISWAESADLGVMPYQPTNLNTIISSPNKMYEFIMARTPMIGSSELVNVEKMINEHGFGIARRLRDPSDYAAAIDEMLDEKSGRLLKAKNELNLKWRQFTWENLSRGFVNAYSSLLNS